MNKFTAALGIAIVALFALLQNAKAQSYSTIDADLGLYCADLPDGTNTLARVVSKNGLSTVNPVDPVAEIKTVRKLIRKIQKRIRTLTELKKEYDPRSDKKKLSEVFTFVLNELVSDDSLDKTKPNQIFKRIGIMLTELRFRLDELQNVLETIRRCTNNEDLIPPPEAISPQIITFSFRHPDYGTTEVMRGLGVAAKINKKAKFPKVCVSASKSNIDLRTFPAESQISLARNPCLMFFQRTFRNYPFCSYGPPNTAVGWFGITKAGFSQSPVDESELKSLQQKLEGYGKIYVRAPTKKKPCRTKK